jgi:chaperone required for assembly of F1-ATPase
MSIDAFLTMFGSREAHEPRDPMKAAQSEMKPAAPKRFYTEVGLAPEQGRWRLTLDGRGARTPAGHPLVMPSEALGEALATEWRAQGERLDVARMPLTRLANSALDGVRANAAEVRAEIVRFAGSDQVCYRAEAPASLGEAQAARWDPVLAWTHEQLGARFILAGGVIHVAQPAGSIARIAAAVDDVTEPLALAALATVTTLTGSALIALALAHGALDADEAWTAGHVDELYQASVWGADDEAEQRLANRRIDFDAAALVLRNSPMAAGQGS